MASRLSGESRVAFQSASNQPPPNVFITVVIGAITSPQPARPRRQMPEKSSSGAFSSAASSRTSSHVGFAGISSPACSNRSVR
jgi:hypothetical protein